MFILGLERRVGCSHCIYIGQLITAYNSQSRGSWHPTPHPLPPCFWLPWILYSMHVLKYRQAHVIQNGKKKLTEFILSAVWIMSSDLLKCVMEDLFEKMCWDVEWGLGWTCYSTSHRRGSSILGWTWRVVVGLTHRETQCTGCLNVKCWIIHFEAMGKTKIENLK